MSELETNVEEVVVEETTECGEDCNCHQAE